MVVQDFLYGLSENMCMYTREELSNNLTLCLKYMFITAGEIWRQLMLDDVKLTISASIESKLLGVRRDLMQHMDASLKRNVEYVETSLKSYVDAHLEQKIKKETSEMMRIQSEMKNDMALLKSRQD